MSKYYNNGVLYNAHLVHPPLKIWLRHDKCYHVFLIQTFELFRYIFGTILIINNIHNQISSRIVLSQK